MKGMSNPPSIISQHRGLTCDFINSSAINRIINQFVWLWCLISFPYLIICRLTWWCTGEHQSILCRRWMFSSCPCGFSSGFSGFLLYSPWLTANTVQWVRAAACRCRWTCSAQAPSQAPPPAPPNMVTSGLKKNCLYVSVRRVVCQPVQGATSPNVISLWRCVRGIVNGWVDTFLFAFSNVTFVLPSERVSILAHIFCSLEPSAARKPIRSHLYLLPRCFPYMLSVHH